MKSTFSRCVVSGFVATVLAGAAHAEELVVGIFGPTANGDRFTLFQILLAVIASTVIVLILIGLTYYRLPWRKLPDAGVPQAKAPPIVEPSIPAPQPAPQPAKPGAYAESP